MEAQGFPVIQQPFVDERGYVTQAWRQLLVYLWKQLGSGGGNSGTLLVNPGTGNNTRQLNAALADYANVNDYLNVGDTHYDGAISRALADKNKAYFPSKPTISDPDNFYRTLATVILHSGQSIIGDGAGVSRWVCETPNQPVITLSNNMFWFHLRGMTIAHDGAAAVAGGDGIYQAQGPTFWVDNALIEDVLFAANYHGVNLGKAFSGTIANVIASGNVRNGFNFLTDGNSTVVAGATNGPLQWILINCASRANGYDGFAYTVTGTAFGGFGVGSSLGTLENCVTFSNGHHGMSFIGTAAQPLQSVRIAGGFVGQDAGQGIYLSTYGIDHIVAPDFVELAGASNIYIDANNRLIQIRTNLCIGAWLDGITSTGATDVLVNGGIFQNNGRQQAGGVTYAGIRIDGGSAQINNVRALDDSGAGLQDYGLSITGDNVIVTGSRLTNNVVAPIIWTTGPTNSVVVGNLPASINTNILGDVQVNSLGVGIAPSGVAGEARINAAASINGGLTITAGGLTLTTGVVGNGITADNMRLNFSAGIGMAASGAAGRLDVAGLTSTNTLAVASTSTFNGAVTVNATLTGNAINGTTITSSVDLVANGQFHANGSAAFASGITVTSGGMTFTTGVVGNGLTVDNIRINFSLGVGVAASGTAGRIDLTNAIALNGVVYTNP